MIKKNIHPVMGFLILAFITIILSAVLNILDITTTEYKINSTTLEYSTETLKINNLLSFNGAKYIFSETVSNFVNFTPFSTFIIILISFGVMEKSGFLESAITFITKMMKKNTVTFLIVFLSVIGSILGDISFVILLPLSALIFKYGRRNPLIGIIASYAGLTCGQGLSIIFTSVDSSLLSVSLTAARVIDPAYRMASISGLFIMLVASVIMSFIITRITEKNVSPLFASKEKNEEEEKILTRKEIRGLLFAVFAGLIYIIIFIYNIIPSLPFGGNLLDNSQVLYVDKLFSYNSFFSKGFVFIVAIFFITLGLFYGIGSHKFKNELDFVDSLGYSLDNVGNTIVLIFMASFFISVFKYSNLGSVITASLANILRLVKLQGIPLILALVIITAISTLVFPASVSKWYIISPIAIPIFLNAGITPEFTQVIFRFSECITFGLTPVMAYFVIYLAILNKNSDETIGIYNAIRYIFPYIGWTAIILISLLIIWYISGIPIGINGVTVL